MIFKNNLFIFLNLKNIEKIKLLFLFIKKLKLQLGQFPSP